MLTLLALAFAEDFRPTFDEHTVEPPDGPEMLRPEPADPHDHTVQATVMHRLGEEDPHQHDWVDERLLTLSLIGDVGRRYFVICTAFADGEILHWQQGPYDAPGMSVVVALSPPGEVAAAVARAGTGSLSVQIVSTALDGSSVRTEPGARTELTHSLVGTLGVPKGARFSTLAPTEEW